VAVGRVLGRRLRRPGHAVMKIEALAGDGIGSEITSFALEALKPGI
jgi:hypothetical protein